MSQSQESYELKLAVKHFESKLKEKTEHSLIKNMIKEELYRKSPNCYKLFLEAISFCSDCSSCPKYGMTFLFLESLIDYVTVKRPGDMITLELQLQAFDKCSKQPNTYFASLVFDLFHLREISNVFVSPIKELIAQKMYRQASIMIMLLKLQEEFTLDEVIIPLFFRGITNLIDNYLKGHRNLQIEFAKYMDEMVGNPEKFNENFRSAQIGKGTFLKPFGNNLVRIMKKFLKRHDLPQDCCPNYIINQRRATHRYLIYKRFVNHEMEDESWAELVQASVSNDPKIQMEFVNELAAFGHLQRALKWAISHDIPQNYWSSQIKEAFEQGLHTRPSEEVFTKPHDLNTSEYLNFNLDPDKDIFFVEDRQQFLDCIDDITRNDVMGMDAEWKPTCSNQPIRLSIFQIAVWDAVYLLDFLSLRNLLTVEDWTRLIQGVFNNPKIIKLGYGIAGDLSKLLGLCPDAKLIHRQPQSVIDLGEFVKYVKFHFPKLLDKEHSLNPCRGLSKLCAALLGQPLCKTEQLSDWERRPLRKPQKVYAALDAFCLLQIYEVLSERAEINDLDLKTLIQKYQMKSKRHKNKSQTGKSSSMSSKNPSVEVESENSKAVRPENKGPLPISQFRVLVDAMISGLGKHLRILGADVILMPTKQDCTVSAQIAQEENRLILSAGIPYRNLQKFVTDDQIYCVTSLTNLDKQLEEVIKHFNLIVTEKDVFSRCPECNGNEYVYLASPVMKKLYDGEPLEPHHWVAGGKQLDVRDNRLPNGVEIKIPEFPLSMFEKKKRFDICISCGNVYCNGNYLRRTLAKHGHLLTTLPSEDSPESQITSHLEDPFQRREESPDNEELPSTSQSIPNELNLSHSSFHEYSSEFSTEKDGDEQNLPNKKLCIEKHSSSK